jgi:hypothetical protein
MRLILVLAFFLSAVIARNAGVVIDPNGSPGMRLDAGSAMDPNGGSSAVSTLAGDRGAGLDPNG